MYFQTSTLTAICSGELKQSYVFRIFSGNMSTSEKIKHVVLKYFWSSIKPTLNTDARLNGTSSTYPHIIINLNQ